jgi:three-Cys-motif partner protein
MCRNRETREKLIAKDGYCLNVRGADGLPVRCVGGWGQEKVLILSRYFKQIGTSLGKHNLNYIEICSGPGTCIDYRSGEEFNGTPLAILKTKQAAKFNHLFFFDHDQNTVEILKQRIQLCDEISFEVKQRTIVSTGDYFKPESIVEIVRDNTSNPWLNLVFIDPTDVSVPFKLSESLMSLCHRTDFIINFMDGVDLRRNLVQSVNGIGLKIREKYSKVLRDPLAFFEDEETLNLAIENDIVELVERYQDGYLKPYKDMKYNFISDARIRHYYKLYFISKSKLGLKFWANATAKKVEEVEQSQGLLFGY